MEITGALRRNDLDKWEIIDDVGRVRELSSGSACDVLIGGHWIAMRIEFGHGSHPLRGALASVRGTASYDGYYYAVELAILLSEGWPMRA
jgi:hypothetical protein